MPKRAKKETVAPVGPAVKIGVTVPAHVRDQIEQVARSEQRSVAGQVNKWIQDGLRQQAVA